MVRKLTEAWDPGDFLQFASQGQTVIMTSPPGLLDFESWMNTSNNTFPCVYITPDLPTELYGGFFFYTAENFLDTYEIMRFYSDTTLLGSLRIWIGNDKFQLITGGIVRLSGTLNFQTHTRYHVQWRYKVHATTGAFDVMIDDNLDQLFFSGDTRGAGAAYVNKIEHHPSSLFFDSYFVNDISGAEDNAHGGILHMKSFVPITDGSHVAWPLSSGANGYAMVNQTPHDSDTTYAYSVVANQKRSFGVVAHGLTSPSEIRAVSARWVVRKVGNGAVRPFFRIGGVDYPIAAASVPVGVGYTCINDRRTTNPATALPWDLADTIDSVGLESIF
jgi:hypothetical protein